MKRAMTVPVEYTWHRVDDGEIKPTHVEVLEERAEAYVALQMKRGFTNGWVRKNIRLTNADGNAGIDYTGHFTTVVDDVEPALVINASQLALKAAVGEYVHEPDMTVNEIMYTLSQSPDSEPTINVNTCAYGWTGKQLITEITELMQGLKSLIVVGFEAAKQGKEII